MSVQNKDKKKFLFTFKGEMKKGELITKYYQGNLENLVICSPFNKDKIAKNLCGLSNSEGGSIFFGLNDNFIEGINSFPDGEKMTGEKWILEITKLSQMLFNTVTKKSIKIDNKKRFYNNYKVIDENNNESYLTEIVVLNDSDKLYYKDVEYVRKSGETIRVDGKVSSGSSSGSDGEIELPLIPEILSEDVVNLKEGIFNHENSPYEIGNIFNAFEGQNLEYKENVECLNLGQYPIIKYISGFANTKGGKVVVGIKDNREIVGVSIPDEKRDKITLGITNRISLNCSKQSFLANVNILLVPVRKQGYFLLVIDIPKNNGEPIMYKNKDNCLVKWIRFHASTRMEVDNSYVSQEDYIRAKDEAKKLNEQEKQESRKKDEMIRQLQDALNKSNNVVQLFAIQSKGLQNVALQMKLNQFIASVSGATSFQQKAGLILNFISNNVEFNYLLQNPEIRQYLEGLSNYVNLMNSQTIMMLQYYQQQSSLLQQHVILAQQMQQVGVMQRQQQLGALNYLRQFQMQGVQFPVLNPMVNIVFPRV